MSSDCAMLYVDAGVFFIGTGSNSSYLAFVRLISHRRRISRFSFYLFYSKIPNVLQKKQNWFLEMMGSFINKDLS